MSECDHEMERGNGMAFMDHCSLCGDSELDVARHRIAELEQENARLRDTLEYLKDRASYRCGLDEGWVETVCRAALESSDGKHDV